MLSIQSSEALQTNESTHRLASTTVLPPDSKDGLENNLAAGDVSNTISGKDHADTQSAEVQSETEMKKLGICQMLWVRVRGIIFSLIASVQIAVGNYLFYVLTVDYKEYMFEPLVVLVPRFIVMLLICVCLIPVYQCIIKDNVMEHVWPLTNPESRWTAFLVVVRAFSGTASIILNFYAIKYINPGEVSTILWSNLLFIAILARIFLHETLSIFRICSAILAILGVMIIARPPFLVGATEFDLKLMTGIGFACGSMISSTISTILLGALGHVHFILVNTVFFIVGLVTSVILRYVLHSSRESVKPVETYVYIAIIGVFSCTALLCVTLSFKYEGAGTVSVVRCSEVVFSFLFQMFSAVFPDYIQYTKRIQLFLKILLIHTSLDTLYISMPFIRIDFD